MGQASASFRWLLPGEPVTRAEVLAELLEQGDVTSAAFFSSSGELLEALPGSAPETALQSALKDFLVSVQAVAELLGAPPGQTTLEFGGGLALVCFAQVGASVSVITLTSAVGLSRARSSLQRLLPLLEHPSKAPSGRD